MIQWLKSYAGKLWPILVFVLASLFLAHQDSWWLTASLALISILLVGGFIAFDRNLLLHFLVFSIPVSVVTNFSSGLSLWLPSEGLALVFAALLISYFLLHPSELFGNPLLRHPITLILLLILAWDLMSAIQSFYTFVALKRVAVKAIYILVYYIGIGLWLQEKPKVAASLFITFAAAMVVPVINGLWAHQSLGFSPADAIYMPKPFFPEHTLYGAVLAFATLTSGACLLFAKRLNLSIGLQGVLVVLIPILIIGLVYSYSRAAWLSVFFALVVFALIRIGLRFSGFLFLLLCLGFLAVAFQDTIISRMEQSKAVSNKGGFTEHLQSTTNVSTDVSNLERLNRWKSAWRMFKHKPIIGHGPGTYQFIYGKFQKREDMTRISTFTGDKGNAHSEYLTALSESGLVGGILFVLWVLISFQTAINVLNGTLAPKEKAIACIALIGLLSWWVHGLFNTFSDFDKIAVLIYMCSAILVVYDQKRLLISKDDSVRLN